MPDCHQKTVILSSWGGAENLWIQSNTTKNDVKTKTFKKDKKKNEENSSLPRGLVLLVDEMKLVLVITPLLELMGCEADIFFQFCHTKAHYKRLLQLTLWIVAICY